MNSAFKAVGVENEADRCRSCYLCDNQLQDTPRNIDRLFHATQNTDGDPPESLAITLSGILELNIDESTAHSKVMCRKCQRMCSQYEAMSKQLQILRQSIINQYAETTNKYNVRVIEMDYRDNFEETHEQTEHDSNAMPNMYTIEAVDGDVLGDVLNDEHIVTDKTPKGLQMKKVMLVKPTDTETNPFFAIADMDDTLGDDHTIQTVLLDDIDETIEYSDSANNTNDSISDDTETGDPINDYVASEHLDDACEEYFQTNGDQLIEINANGEIDGATYQYMYPDDSSDQMDNDEGSILMEEAIKAESDGVADLSYSLQRTSVSSKKSNEFTEQKQLFIRDGKNFQCCLCVPQTGVVYDTKTISIHLKSDHNERIYVCSICGMDFRKRNPYNEHMDDHMAESADGAYECELCKTVFTDARQFRMHKKTHSTAAKIWSCNACGKKYSSKNLLDEHMNMHTGK